MSCSPGAAREQRFTGACELPGTWQRLRASRQAAREPGRPGCQGASRKSGSGQAGSQHSPGRVCKPSIGSRDVREGPDTLRARMSWELAGGGFPSSPRGAEAQAGVLWHSWAGHRDQKPSWRFSAEEQQGKVGQIRLKGTKH